MSGVFKHDRLRARWGAGLASLGVAALALLASGAGASARAETVTGVTQYGYDVAGRQICATTRMNPAAFSAAVSACSLGTAGTDGPDRITYTEYDTVNRVKKVTSGYASSDPRVEKDVTYTDNGKEKTVADGKGAGNLTTYEYDGFDRLVKERFPSPNTAGVSSTTDYNEYGYDAAGNRISWRQRDGTILTFAFDALNRASNGVRGEAYVYDNLGRRTSATYLGQTASAAYDALGRMMSETTNGLTMSYQYDLAGRRTLITWPDGVFMAYPRNSVGEIVGLYEGGVTPVAAYGYDNLGRLGHSWLGHGAPTVDTWRAYDAASRLSALAQDPAGTAQDIVWNFTYNAAGQVKTRTASSGLYEWSGTQPSKTYTVNGLNQLTTVVSGTTDTVSYDPRGNMAVQGGVSFGYDRLNNLTSTSTGAELAYEPTGRLWQMTASGVTTQFLYSGPDLVAEYANGTMLRRYAPGVGVDAPALWYEGSGLGDLRYLVADPQGSIVAVANATGGVIQTNTYDEYGAPAATNQGMRFQYTGQIWLPEAGVYHYKARAYSPTLGRFLQTDPIGYGDGLNWYAYVGNDPMNKSDPTGLFGNDTSMCGSDFNTGNCSTIIGGETEGGGSPSAPDQAGPAPQIKLAANDAGETGPILEPLLKFGVEVGEQVRPAPRPSVPYPTDPTKAPGPGWTWRGAPGSQPGDGAKGNWFNPKTGESLHPDRAHGPFPEHMDYSPGRGQGGRGQGWRWYPDGRMEPKAGTGGEILPPNRLGCRAGQACI